MYLQVAGNIFSCQPWNIHQVQYFLGTDFCGTDKTCYVLSRIEILACVREFNMLVREKEELLICINKKFSTYYHIQSDSLLSQISDGDQQTKLL